ncbi:MAG: hypothetical protein WCF30_13550 [Terracidiphilus sp.]
MAVTGQKTHISLQLANRILEMFEESGASETERHAALAVVMAMVPVLPNASCSVEKNELIEECGQ